MVKLVSRLILAALVAWLHLVPWTAGKWIDFNWAVFELIALQAELLPLAAWLVFGPGAGIIRVLGCLVGISAVWLTGFQVARKVALFSDPYSASSIATTALGLQFVIVTVIFLVGYRLRGYRGVLQGAAELAPRQFSLRQAFILMTLFGIVLAVGRLSWPNDWSQAGTPDRLTRQLVISVTFVGAVLSPGIWMAVMRPGWWIAWLLPVFLLLTVAQGLYLGLLFGELGSTLQVEELAWSLAENVFWNGIQLLPVVVFAILVRAGGWTIERPA